MNPFRIVTQRSAGLRRSLNAQQQRRRNRTTIQHQAQTGAVFFDLELQQLLDCDDGWLRATSREYTACPAAWEALSGLQSRTRSNDGVAKTLDLAEGFALWALVKYLRPQVVVELGVNLGVSARLWKEALRCYVPEHRLILCDLEDHRRLIGDEEATFYRADAKIVLPQVLAEQRVDILHNDAHPYDLIHWSVETAFAHQVPCLTFHDVGRGRRGPFKLESSRLSPEAKRREGDNWAEYGHWERHVMAELLAPELLLQDFASTTNWRVQIFDSLFGFGAALRQPPSP
jgi:hypothetical protein